MEVGENGASVAPCLDLLTAGDLGSDCRVCTPVLICKILNNTKSVPNKRYASICMKPQNNMLKTLVYIKVHPMSTD